MNNYTLLDYILSERVCYFLRADFRAPAENFTLPDNLLLDLEKIRYLPMLVSEYE